MGHWPGYFLRREQLAIIRPVDGVLTMAFLNYESEVRKPSDVKSEFVRAHTSSSQLRLAEQLVGQWHEGKFDFSQYRDRYHEKIKRAIEAKRKGEEMEAPEEEEPQVINLMDALKRSVAHASENGHPRHKRHAKQRGKSGDAPHRRRA